MNRRSRPRQGILALLRLTISFLSVLIVILTAVEVVRFQEKHLTPLGTYTLTFYCSCETCSGQWGTSTALGTETIEGYTVAVDRSVIPLGTVLYIDGYGDFLAEDVGGGIKGNHIDIYVEDHRRALQLGVDEAAVYCYPEGTELDKSTAHTVEHPNS
ncbi:MAG: 3D domain-containing protein [Butyricicoccaceae bacterium]